MSEQHLDTVWIVPTPDGYWVWFKKASNGVVVAESDSVYVDDHGARRAARDEFGSSVKYKLPSKEQIKANPRKAKVTKEAKKDKPELIKRVEKTEPPESGE